MRWGVQDVIFERVLPILTHFNTCVLGGCKIGANADTDVDATQELDFDELTSAWFHGMPTFSLKTVDFLELVVAAGLSGWTLCLMHSGVSV